MEKINNVAIIGAGALGLLYMESLSSNCNLDLYFLTDENRFPIYKDKYFNINNKKIKFPVKSISNITNKADLVIVSVKNYNLNEIKPLLLKVAGEKTSIISVLNGITSEKFLEDLLPESTVLYSAAIGMDAVKYNNRLQYTKKGKLLIGTKTNEINTQLIQVTKLLKNCNLSYLVPSDIHKELWYKWMVNIGVNQVSAVTGSTYKFFQTKRNTQILMENAMNEVITIANKEGINLNSSDIKKWYDVLNTLGPNGKTSMLQDIEANRKTEVESFSGELIKLSRKHNIKVPVNDTLYRIIINKTDNI